MVDETDPETDAPVETDDTDVDVETDTDTDVEPVVVPSTVVELGQIACVEPARRAEQPYVLMDVRTSVPPIAYTAGGAAGVGDLDDDGYNDIVGLAYNEALLFLHEGPMRLTRQSLYTLDVPVVRTGLLGVTVVDIEDDGDLDVLVTGRGVPNRLLINDGTAHFTDGTVAAGLGGIPDDHYTAASSWSDWDGDGDLDLFLAGNGFVDEYIDTEDFGPADPSYLFENQGDGTFVDVSERLPPALHDDYTFVGGWFDGDGDGDDDLYLVNDFGSSRTPTRIAWNDGGFFRMDDSDRGLDLYVEGMGLGIGDFDGDLDEDLAVAGWREVVVLVNEQGLYFNSTDALGIRLRPSQFVSWGTEFFDGDNDGDLDLFVAFGWLGTLHGAAQPDSQPDALFEQGDDGLFTDVARRTGLDDGASNRSANAADIDGNGWLDLVKMGLDGVGRVYFATCGEKAWLTVELRQPAPNTRAIGATLIARAGDEAWMRRLRAGGTGFGTGGPPEVHFGLGDVATLDSLEVHWPDGRIEVFEDLDTRQKVRIERAAP